VLPTLDWILRLLPYSDLDYVPNTEDDWDLRIAMADRTAGGQANGGMLG
jgi:hypothetical protein